MGMRRAWGHGVRLVGDERVADGLLALLLAAAHLSALGFLGRSCDCPPVDRRLALPLIALETLPLAWRRSHPVAAWLVVGLASVAYGIQPWPDPPIAFGAVVAVYSLAAWTRRRTAILLGLATAVGLLLALALPSTDAHAKDYTFNYLVLATAWALGDGARARRAYLAQLEDRAARLERERELQARRAAADERARIARELHDMVAHHVSMMVVQAEAGPVVVEREPARAVEAFDSISATGRQALAEMRRLLGVLRQDGEAGAPAAAPAAVLAPQPGLGEVGALVDQVRRAGVPVELVVEGSPGPLPPAVDLSAYRIVQEALTNTVKHAGPARARVLVRYGARDLELEVSDDGAGAAPAPRPPGGGHGLVGMHERVSLFGGELHAGPRPAGGFVVSARLPLGTGR